ncbi:MAG: hypothetical protein Q4F65_14445, partial [Propionibacteriaceae bacterium]|nr:hypothetical protein [Propionibacteriaceae bacterium]
YLLWLAAPTAVLVALARPAQAGRRGAGVPAWAPALLTFAMVLALCCLTLAVYPVHYAGVTQRGPLTDRALLLLTVRNLGLVALVAWSAACALHASRGTSRQQTATVGGRR